MRRGREQKTTEVHLSERLRAFIYARGSILLLSGNTALHITDLEMKKLVEAHGRLSRSTDTS